MRCWQSRDVPSRFDKDDTMYKYVHKYIPLNFSRHPAQDDRSVFRRVAIASVWCPCDSLAGYSVLTESSRRGRFTKICCMWTL